MTALWIILFVVACFGACYLGAKFVTWLIWKILGLGHDDVISVEWRKKDES